MSEAARVVFTIQRIMPGRTVGRACLPETKRNHTNRSCARLGKPRQFALNAVAAQNRARFSGRIGGHALTPGRYRATLIATDAAGRQSSAKRLSFRIVRG
jgi:hypothetical protein